MPAKRSSQSKRSGLALLLAGLALIPTSCVLFPSQFGSDYTGINLGGVLGATLGVIVAIGGLVMLALREDSDQ